MNEDRVSILLVGDRVEDLAAIETLLNGLGQNLVRAESRMDGLRLLLHQEFGLIIFDVDTPVGDGFEIAALVRNCEKSQHTPIIFLATADPTGRRSSDGYSHARVDYVTKPFAPEVLLAKASALIELHQKNQEIKGQAHLLQQMVAELASSNQQIQKLHAELQSEQDFISAVLDTADSIVMLLDEEQKIIRANRAFERILGYTQYELAGRNLSSFFVTAASCELTQAETYWQAKDGTMRLIVWFKTALDSNHVLLTGNDVTERKRAEQQRERVIQAEAARAEAEAWERRSKFLAEASTMLSATLDYEKTLMNISRLAIPTFADWCFLYVALEGGQISSARVAHAAPDKERLAQQVEIRPEDLSSDVLPAARVFQTGTPELFADFSDEELQRAVQDEQKFETLKLLGLHSGVVVPIAGRQDILGVIGF